MTPESDSYIASYDYISNKFNFCSSLNITDYNDAKTMLLEAR